MKITTKDTTYNFSGNDYYLEYDTLIAEISKKLDKNTSLNFNVEIPVNDMEIVEGERTDVLLTTLTVLGILVGILALMAQGIRVKAFPSK